MTENRLVIVTTVRNEEKYLPETIAAVVAETVKPWKWIIVDDGSIDRTLEIATTASRLHPWIEVLHIEDRGYTKFVGTDVEGFRQGLRHLNNVQYEFICKLDGDLKLPPQYIEKILQKFAANPRLGIAGGTWIEPSKGKLKRVRTLPEFPFGGARVWRKKCLLDISPLFTSSGWDRLDCYSAMMHGWKTEVFNDPELESLHQRQMGSLGKGIIKQYGRDGISSYYQGDHPIYVLASVLYKMTEPPLIVAGIRRLIGYLSVWVKRAPRCQDEKLVQYLRSWQLRKIRSELRKQIVGLSLIHLKRQ
jgi:glycosyltransferase involved in cell wall biosynthesis